MGSPHQPGAAAVLNETATGDRCRRLCHPDIMRRLAADWVPDGAWLAPGYAEWRAPAALRETVACLWARVSVEDDPGGEGLVLPDACSDLIWEQGVGAYVAGPDTGPGLPGPAARPGPVLVGVRFRPSAGGAALGVPLDEIRDQRVGLADLMPAAARRLDPELAPAGAAAAALDVAGRLIAGQLPDRAMARAAELLRDPSARAGEVAASVGLSERQLRRRCHAAAGYGPKTLQRVFRFQRFVQRLDASEAGSLDLAAAAAEAGYADQSHLTRDCTALSGLTPAALARTRRPASA